MGRSKVGRVLLWGVSSLAALYFVFVGAEKFSSVFWFKAFSRWGYSGSFRMLIGVVEMTGGLLLAFPRTTVYGAVVIDIVMLGAVGTLIRFHEHLFAPIFLLVTISLIAYGRRHQAWRPNGRHTPTAVDTV